RGNSSIGSPRSDSSTASSASRVRPRDNGRECLRLNASEVTERGLLGDRQFAVVDRATGKVGGAKNPRKWGNFFDFRAGYVGPPQTGSQMPAVRITLPDGAIVTSEQGDLERSEER